VSILFYIFLFVPPYLHDISLGHNVYDGIMGKIKAELLMIEVIVECMTLSSLLCLLCVLYAICQLSDLTVDLFYNQYYPNLKNIYFHAK
jgi:hypothetical protein